MELCCTSVPEIPVQFLDVGPNQTIGFVKTLLASVHGTDPSLVKLYVDDVIPEDTLMIEKYQLGQPTWHYKFQQQIVIHNTETGQDGVYNFTPKPGQTLGEIIDHGFKNYLALYNEADELVHPTDVLDGLAHGTRFVLGPGPGYVQAEIVFNGDYLTHKIVPVEPSKSYYLTLLQQHMLIDDTVDIIFMTHPSSGTFEIVPSPALETHQYIRLRIKDKIMLKIIGLDQVCQEMWFQNNESIQGRRFSTLETNLIDKYPSHMFPIFLRDRTRKTGAIIVQPHTTINELKQQFLRRNHPNVEHITLFNWENTNAVIYSDDETMESLCFGAEDSVQYVFTQPCVRIQHFNCHSGMPIYVHCLTGDTIVVWMNPNETVFDVMCRIHDSKGIPTDQQRLLYTGRQLDQNRMLNEYGIRAHSSLNMVLNLRGGGVGTSFADPDNRTDLRVVTEGPAWRAIRPGINLEGRCRNSQCQAHNHIVICQLGTGEFDLILDQKKAQCPMCYKQIRVRTAGLYKCWWDWAGQEEGSNSFRSGIWTRVGRVYSRFNPAQDNIRSWIKMRIRARGMTNKVSSPYNKNTQPTIVISHASKKADPVDSMCAICLDDGSNDPCKLECGHSFHRACIEDWANRSQECPMCRAQFSL